MSARAMRGYVAVALLSLGVVRCSAADAATDPAEAEHTAEVPGVAPAPATERIQGAGAPEPGALPMVAALPVAEWTGPEARPFEVAARTPEPGAAHARQFGSRTLGIALRTRAPDLAQYPCSACHLGRALIAAAGEPDDAHRDIATVHPRATGTGCMTCHAAADVELLALQSGEQVTMDRAYRLCAQCHVAQVEAWSAGAHGKRLDGWQGRRVVMNCADCHDPHRPALEGRVPFRAPRLHRNGSREP